MPTITENDLIKTMHLAQLDLAKDMPIYKQHLADVLEFVAPICEVDAKNVEPMLYIQDFSLRLRADNITESNQRDMLQTSAAHVEDGFYLVPEVIKTCETEN